MTDKIQVLQVQKLESFCFTLVPANNEEVKEFERSLDKMESDYDKCLADNKRLGDKIKHSCKTSIQSVFQDRIAGDKETSINYDKGHSESLHLKLSFQRKDDHHQDMDGKPQNQHMKNVDVGTHVELSTASTHSRTKIHSGDRWLSSMLKIAQMKSWKLLAKKNSGPTASENPIMSTDAIVKPLELTPCVSSSSSSTVTMVSRFFDYRLGDRKAGSKGISVILWNAEERDVVPPGLDFPLTSDIVVPPSSNCLCEDLRSACDREHTKVLELEAEVLKQQKDGHRHFCASNVFLNNKLRKQLQGKDDTIRNLDAQINIMKVLNVGSTVGSFDKQALETELTQLKDAITSVRIQNDGFKAENVNLKRHYEELSKSNAYSRSTFTAKINALTAENAKLKTELSGKKSSGSTAFEKPKVLASGMYTNSSKYIPPPKRANWVKPTPLPKNKQVTFQEPPRTSNRPTQKPQVQQNMKPKVPVNLSTRTKPATESRKPMPKCHTRNHHILPSRSVNARRAVCLGDQLERLLVVLSLSGNPRDDILLLYDNCPLTRIMVNPLLSFRELTPSVSSVQGKRTYVADLYCEDCHGPNPTSSRSDAVSLPVWVFEGLVSIAHLIFVLFHLTSYFEGEIDTF
ncbi:hypothetical protein Tco_0305419 [Tanacetum coccineum]